jgi:ATP-dependent exoDNAse (exonuclease V) beta subunit
VRIELLTNKDYQQQTLERLDSTIEELMAQGIPQQKMAILVRTNSYIPIIANFFAEHRPEISIVSDEAFRLDASPAVKVIIQAMRFLVNPDDKIAKAFLAKAWEDKPLHEETTLPERFTNEKDDLLRMPIYELAEQLYDIFHLERLKGQSAYLCAFYDQIAAFVDEQQGDISMFLKEWDNTLCGKTIQSPETDGIRLISIHKSKGLEFPTVIIPFCDWRMEHNDILWCKPTEDPFNQLPIVPVDFSAKQMEGTIYESYYDEEHQQNIVDNLNLLYVAFTRAANNLFVIGKRGTNTSRSAIIEQVLPMLSIDDAVISGVEDENATMEFTFGVLSHKQHKQEKAHQPNVFLTIPTPIEVDIHTFEQKVIFRQSNKSQEFADTEENEETERQKGYIPMGSVLHHVFSTIRTTADINQALDQLEGEGVIYDDEITRERIERMIRKRLESPRVADWFSDRWQLFNECTILNVDPITNKVYERRPDRVMTDGNEMIVVDFKFGHPRDAYHDQVREYIHLLENMGYRNIKGYLWYVYSNEIIEVS